LGIYIAFRGYTITSNQEAIINNNLEIYPNLIQSLLSNQTKLDDIGIKAQELAKKYDYNQVYQSYIQIIENKNTQPKS